MGLFVLIEYKMMEQGQNKRHKERNQPGISADLQGVMNFGQ
jgi:hypothetical protein